MGELTWCDERRCAMRGEDETGFPPDDSDLEDLRRARERAKSIPLNDDEEREPPKSEGAPSSAPAHLSIADALTAAWSNIEARAAGKLAPVPLPIASWAKILGGGFHPGVHLLVGPTKSGKSTLASQVALHAAQQGHPVGLCPIELGEEQATVRLLGELAEVPWSALMTGTLDLSEVQRRTLMHSAEALARLPITIEAMVGPWPASNLRPLAAKLAKQAEEHAGRTPLVIVDFLQLAAAEEGDRSDLRQTIGKAAYELHFAARNLGCAVLAISSTARAFYTLLGGVEGAMKQAGVRLRADGSVDYGDAIVGVGKESGELEYSATSLNVLMRVPGAGKGRMALVVPAQRFGPSGWVPVTLDGWRIDSPLDDRELTEQRAEVAEVFTTLDEKPKSKHGKHNNDHSDLLDQIRTAGGRV